ncbi:MerR family transcriptional regulator [Microbacterium pullorum]|nr:hypothetical protein [Microbacterium pullorum]
MRGSGEAADRVSFLRRHRSNLEERTAAIAAAIGVLDDKIAYYSASE